nr:actin-depolymerizing factor 7 [Tanacetum cinerariifolium]
NGPIFDSVENGSTLDAKRKRGVSPDETYEDFTNSLPTDECRYPVFDFDVTRSGIRIAYSSASVVVAAATEVPKSASDLEDLKMLASGPTPYNLLLSSFDFVFSSKIFKSLSFCLDRLFHLAILCLDHHDHTLHHLERILTISLDKLDISKEDLVYQSLRKSLSLCLSFLDS